MIKKIVAALLALGITTSASGSDNFQYWSYWIGSEIGWQAASQGAGTTPTQDEMVQGWRFVETGVGLNADQAPISSPKFSELCPELAEPKSGVDRVAVVIDYGNVESAETPPTPRTVVHCLTVKSQTRSIDLLAQVTEVRENAGFICGLSNYPKTGCGEAVSGSTQSGNAAEDSESTNGFIYLTVFLIGAGAFLGLRVKNRKPTSD